LGKFVQHLFLTTQFLALVQFQRLPCGLLLFQLLNLLKLLLEIADFLESFVFVSDSVTGTRGVRGVVSCLGLKQLMTVIIFGVCTISSVDC